MEKPKRVLQPNSSDIEKAESYTIHVREIFNLGAGGDPELPEGFRTCDANCDKISIVLNTMGNGLNLKQYAGEGLSRFASQDECYRQLLVLALAAGDPLVLCGLGKPLRTGTADFS